MSVSRFTPERSSDFTETRFDDSVVDCMLGVLGNRILTCADWSIHDRRAATVIFNQIKDVYSSFFSKSISSPNSLHKSKSNSGGVITSQVSND